MKNAQGYNLEGCVEINDDTLKKKKHNAPAPDLVAEQKISQCDKSIPSSLATDPVLPVFKPAFASIS